MSERSILGSIFVFFLKFAGFVVFELVLLFFAWLFAALVTRSSDTITLIFWGVNFLLVLYWYFGGKQKRKIKALKRKDKNRLYTIEMKASRIAMNRTENLGGTYEEHYNEVYTDLLYKSNLEMEEEKAKKREELKRKVDLYNKRNPGKEKA